MGVFFPEGKKSLSGSFYTHFIKVDIILKLKARCYNFKNDKILKSESKGVFLLYLIYIIIDFYI